jgi:hypothetical protein
MKNLSQRALLGFIRLELFLALLLFLPARSLRFWEAWIYWILFSRLRAAHHTVFPEARSRTGYHGRLGPSVFRLGVNQQLALLRVSCSMDTNEV